MHRLIRLPLIILVVGVLVFGWRWYSYVSNTRSAYDEVGIELNGYAPAVLRDWGCARLRARFGNGPPPLHCEEPGGAPGEWRRAG